MKTLKLTGSPEPSKAQIQASLVSRLLARGYVVLRVNGGGFKDSRGQFVKSYNIAGLEACAGFPDVVGFRADGLVRLFEIKRAGGQISPAQERFATFAGQRHIRVEVVEGRAGLDALVL